MVQTVAVIARQPQIYNIVKRIKNYNLSYESGDKDEAFKNAKSWMYANILFVVEGASGNMTTVDFIVEIKKVNPVIRVVYFSGELNFKDVDILYKANQLVEYGVYDIYYGKRISQEVIEEYFNRPKNMKDVQHIVDLKNEYIEDNRASVPAFESGYRNIIIVSSIKPGSGKSFVSTNLAAGLAKYGAIKKDGTSPRVAIIDGDLQTLSIGTLLGIEDSRLNLTSAIKSVMAVLDNKGEIIGTEQEIEEVREFVKKCFLPSKTIPNLYGLVGSQLQFKDMGGIRPYHFFYMVQLMVDEFDIIVIDSNSSLEHKTTGPILQLAGFCFYVLDLDFISVRANLRHRQELQKLGVLNKVNYVLNKAITKENSDMFSQKLQYTADHLEGDGFKVAARLPFVDPTIMLNRLYNNTPIILDTHPSTIFIRIELAKIAEMIWPLSNMGALRIQMDDFKKTKKKKKSKTTF